MLQGLRTVIFGVPEIGAAKAWYSTVLGVAPYFDDAFYVGFNVGGYELGLDPSAAVGTGVACGPVAYWGVAKAEAAMEKIVGMGGRVIEAVHHVGDEIQLGTVCDPFGNVFGIIENPHFALPAN
ncbi:MAG: VOC family protein [Herpetosiphon sp.]